MERLSKRIAIAGFSAVLLLFSCVSAAAYWSIRQLLQDQQWVAHTHQVIGALHELSDHVKAAETGQRDYILTADTSDLESYQISKQQISQQLQVIQQLIQDNPDQQRKLAELKLLIHQQMAILQQSVEQVQQRRSQTQLQPVLTNQDNALREKLQAILKEMSQEEAALLQQRTDASSRTVQRLAVVMVVGSCLGLLFLAGVYFLLQNQIRIQQALTEEKLRTQNQMAQARLVQILETVTDAFVSLDSNWCYTYVNQRAGQIFNRQPEDLIGKNIWAEFPEAVGQTFYHAYYEAIAEQKFIQLEEYYPPYDRWFENRIYPSPDGIAIFFQDITPRKRAEIALANSEERYRSLVTATSQIVWVSDAEGTTIIGIDEWQALTGQSAEEVSEWRWLDAIHPDDREETHRIWTAAVANKSLYEREQRIRTAAGIYQDFFIRAVPILEADDSIREWIGTCTDITERKRAETALRQSEQRYRSLVMATSQIVWLADATGMTIHSNFSETTGQAEATSWGLEWLNAVHPDEREQIRQEWLAAVQAQRLYEVVQRTLTKTGEYREYVVRGVPVFDPNGILLEWVGTCTDITDQRRAEAALRKSEQQLQSIMDNATAVIYLKDLDGRFLFVNRSFEALLQTDRDNIIGKTDYDFFPKEMADVFRANDRHVLETQDSLQIEESADGIHIYLSVKFPLFDPNGIPYAVCGFSTDITDRKQAEAQLQQAKDELEIKVQERTLELQHLNLELNRSNQELEQFAYVASHDLQEPLRAVTGYTQLLIQEFPQHHLDESTQEYMTYIIEGAQRMRQLIQDLLAYSRVGTQGRAFVQTDCNEVLKQALENLAVAIAESHAIVTYDHLPTVIADKTQLIQLFQNLIGNAIKFHREAEPPNVHISAEHQRHEVQFWVKDNGIGIKPQYRDRIFEIFKRLHTRREFPGTGIGLAICKKIVERHAGQIWLESEPGVGTTFYFTIPLNAT